MTRAELKALEAYPKTEGIRELKGLSARPVYVAGYEQAEKDLALTWQDIRKITRLYNEIADEFLERYFAQIPVRDEEIYQEVLRRYNENKKNRHESE